MTTIATDGKCVAFDGLACANTIRSTSMIKAREVAPGIIAAASGDLGANQLFIEWVRNCLTAGEALEAPKCGERFQGIVVDTIKGTCQYYDTYLKPVETLLPFAIGSGDELAEGAMLAGAHPMDAVRLACQRDIWSGGDIACLPKSAAEAYERGAGPDCEITRVSKFRYIVDTDPLKTGYVDFYDGIKAAGYFEDLAVDHVEGTVVPHCSVTITEESYIHTKRLFDRVGALLKSEGQDGRTDSNTADRPD